MQRDVEFRSKGVRCRGWLYVPDDLVKGNAAAAIVMAHGFSAVKEMFQVSRYAGRFKDAGFVTLVFDFRFLGASEGDPRGQIVSHEQCEDIRNAITWLSRQPEVDEDRIGVWGPPTAEATSCTWRDSTAVSRLSSRRSRRSTPSNRSFAEADGTASSASWKCWRRTGNSASTGNRRAG